MIDFSKERLGLCVACGQAIAPGPRWICRACRRACDIYIADVRERLSADRMTLDIKSACCRADVWPNQRLTCAPKCHDTLVAYLEGEFGTHKKVVRQATGEAFRIPTRDIIDRGIREQDLDRYPRWEEDAS